MNHRADTVLCLLLAVVSGLFHTAPARAADDASGFQHAIYDDAVFTLHLRSYLMDQTQNPGDDPAAWAGGGWLGYQSGWLGGVLQLGAVGYTSQPLWAPPGRSGTLLLKPGQHAINVLGQAYVALKHEEQVLTLYRQIVDQPEVNPHDSRMVPNTFEGASLKGQWGHIDYYAGVLTAMKERDEDRFENMAEAAGASGNEALYLGGLTWAPGGGLEMRTAFYAVPNILASSYSDAAWTTRIGHGTSLRLAGQFMTQSSIGDDQLTGPGFKAWIGGIKGELAVHGFTLTAGYTGAGTDEDWQAPYGVWPGFTHMVVKDFNRAGEQALLLGAAYDFSGLGLPGLDISARASLDTAVASGLPKRQEYDLSAAYSFASLGDDWKWLRPLELRTRYSRVDIDNPGEPDGAIDDVRIILNYQLQAAGSSF